MDYQYGVYGDSIAFGYGNNNQSWFDINYKGLKSIKLAQNGETIGNVLEKIKVDNNFFEILYIAVGVNDLLSYLPKANAVDLSLLINQYNEILKIAHDKAKKIIVLSVLPVREEEFPNQNWLDENKWVFNLDIQEFNMKLNLLCDKYCAKFIDTYSEFCSCNLKEFYNDAVHLNKLGQEKLASLLSL